MVIFLTLLGGIGLGGLIVWLWARAEITRYQSIESQVRTQAELEQQVKLLAGEALERNSTSLLSLTEAKLGPIKETLERFDAQARALEESGSPPSERSTSFCERSPPGSRSCRRRPATSFLPFAPRTSVVAGASSS